MAMQREEYEALVSSPGWGAFKSFLLDRRSDLMEAIAGDHIVVDDREKAIRECMIYKELANISWEKIEHFYDKGTA